MAIEEAYAATAYIAENGAKLDLDASRLAVAGDSVGGNMAAVTAIAAKRRGGPRIVLQALFYPVTDANFDNASYRRFENGPWLTRKAMEWFWDAYAPDAETRKEITASPLRASVEELAGLPPALIITDGNDPRRNRPGRRCAQEGLRGEITPVHGRVRPARVAGSLASPPGAA